jgi:Sulfotransferase family
MSNQSKDPDLCHPPVFVMGCARSGTTLLYHTLLSSGGFAVYFAEPAVFDMLVPRFKDLGVPRHRAELMKYWLNSKMFRASGLSREEIEVKVLSQCKSNTDFLVIVMQEITRSQGKERWAVWGPDNLLYMPQIKKELPKAKFIHIIRDGRDVALSLHREGWIRPLPWDRDQGLAVAALHWLWKVNRGRKYGRRFGSDYLELRFEDLLSKRDEILRRISEFIGFEIDPEFIEKNALGTLKDSNSTFRSTAQQNVPMGRWRTLLPPPDIDLLESVLGPTLLELGYEVTRQEFMPRSVRTRFLQAAYPAFFEAKLWCKSNTPLGRLVDMSRLRLEQQVT